MNKLEQLKAKMSIGADFDYCLFKGRFDEIAQMLFEDFVIMQGNKRYLFQEVEFYFYNQHHRDVITHPRCSEALCWYVNDFGGIDLNFKSWCNCTQIISKDGRKQGGKYKYSLDETSYFGGILIRKIISEDGSEIFDGPLACAELFRRFDSSGQNSNIPMLVEHNNGKVDFVCKERIRLLTGKQSAETKVHNILYNYSSHPDENRMCEDFRDFYLKPYRYIRCSN